MKGSFGGVSIDRTKGRSEEGYISGINGRYGGTFIDSTKRRIRRTI
jgi:hypothetical protein